MKKHANTTSDKAIKLIVSILISVFIMIIGGVLLNVNHTLGMLIFGIGLIATVILAVTACYHTLSAAKWQCVSCRNVFSPGKFEILFGMNGGLQKRLYCPHCNKKTWCTIYAPNIKVTK